MSIFATRSWRGPTRRQAARAGLTPQRYPGFYKMLDDISARDARGDVAMPVQEDVTNDVIHLNLATQLLALYPTQAGNPGATIPYNASALASLQISNLPTFSVTYASLCFYDQNNNPIGTCQVQNSFTNDAYIPVEQFRC